MYYKVSGIIKDEDGAPTIRDIFLVNQDDFTLISKTRSNSVSGEYMLYTPTNDPVTVVAMPDMGETRNAKVFHNVLPQRTTEYPPGIVNNIGTPGAAGFGVGIAPELPEGFVTIHGFDDYLHENYGNYRVISDGSIMVWIPKFYFKWGNGVNGLAMNVCDIRGVNYYEDETEANADGYALHRVFIDGGEIKDGFFVDKYMNSKNPKLTVASSLYAGTPLSSNASNNPFSVLGVSNALAGAVDAAKLRGSDFFCMSIFIANALAMISKAHGDASANTDFCGWYDSDSTKNFPKGNTQNRAAHNDSSLVVWATNANFSSAAGGWNFVEKTTHNGQKNGVTDVCGNMWNITPGLTLLSNSFRYLKESFAMKDGTSGTSTATDFWNVAPYDDIGANLSDFAGTSGWIYATGGAPIFSTETDRSDVNYKYNCIGVYQPGNFSTSNSNTLGGGIYRSRVNQLCPLVFGAWTSGANAGVFALDLRYAFSYSNANYGFRSALYLSS